MVRFECVDRDGPAVAHAASTVCNGCIYVHGGITRPKSIEPEHKTYKFDPRSSKWHVVSKDGPPICYSGAYTEDDRHVNVVGGWTGKARSFEVEIYTFDTKHDRWLTPGTVEGFPTGGALSSHTVNRLERGALIIGRLGGLRMQRRTAAVLQLTGNHVDGFRFRSHEIHVDSRSGHSSLPGSRRTLVLVGGRNQVHEEMPVDEVEFDRLRFDLSTVRQCELENLQVKPAHTLGKSMVINRRYHCAIGLADGSFLVHGGEGFDHMNLKTSEPRRDVLLYRHGQNEGYNSTVSNWCFVNTHDTAPALSGHETATIDGRVYMFAGFDKHWKPNRKTYQIEG